MRVSGEPSASSIPSEKRLKMDHLGRSDRPWTQCASCYTPATDYGCRLLHQQHIREKSEASPLPEKSE